MGIFRDNRRRVLQICNGQDARKPAAAWIFAAIRAKTKRGCPCGQPLHCQTASGQACCKAGPPARPRDEFVSRGASCEPQSKRGSSPRMPAYAAIDNETLDHLLSVVSGSSSLKQIRVVVKSSNWPRIRASEIHASRLRAKRLTQAFERQLRRGPAEQPSHDLTAAAHLLPLVGIGEHLAQSGCSGGRSVLGHRTGTVRRSQARSGTLTLRRIALHVGFAGGAEQQDRRTSLQ